MTDFAAIEARSAAAVMRRLANAQAEVLAPSDAAGRSFPVVFDAQYATALEVESAGPAALAIDPDLEALSINRDASLRIRGAVYAVRGREPDGTGMTRLLLRREEC